MVLLYVPLKQKMSLKKKISAMMKRMLCFPSFGSIRWLPFIRQTNKDSCLRACLRVCCREAKGAIKKTKKRAKRESETRELER